MALGRIKCCFLFITLFNTHKLIRTTKIYLGEPTSPLNPSKKIRQQRQRVLKFDCDLIKKAEGKCMTSGIITPKRFQAVITHTTFRNFDREECTAIKTCSGCIMGQGGFTVKTQKLKFVKSPRKVFFPYPHCALNKDIDGSVSGLEGSHLLADTGILPDSSCWAVDCIDGGGVSGRVCASNITFHRMSIALERAPSVGYNITLQNSCNQTSSVNYVPDTLSNLYGWQAVLLDKETYTVIFHVPHRKAGLQETIEAHNCEY
ncbi:unnamed protein product [Ranitomeya imitator]|uniref:Uncharacterized protein n=1 Tax=Ranitomeya imitator TaxID=111125 RepID=A0ABN9LDT0_9NEOB|nr:unnamed protein product [Ranitomeya imitator]